MSTDIDSISTDLRGLRVRLWYGYAKTKNRCGINGYPLVHYEFSSNAKHIKLAVLAHNSRSFQDCSEPSLLRASGINLNFEEHVGRGTRERPPLRA